MSIRTLRARLERLQAGADEGYVIGQERDRDRKRREELRRLKLSPGLTNAQAAELAEFDAAFEQEDRDHHRKRELWYKDKFGADALTDAERIEYDELRERYPPNPNPPFGDLAARLGVIAGGSAADRARKKFECERDRAPAEVKESVKSQSDRAAAAGCPAPNAAEKLKPANPDLMTDAELLEQLLLAANHNVAPGDGIDDVRPVRVMLESGIELEDVLCTLKCKVDPRAYPENRALASWSEHRFVRAVAEGYGRRVMFPVIKERLKVLRKRA
jgi:hypothetical protein